MKHVSRRPHNIVSNVIAKHLRYQLQATTQSDSGQVETHCSHWYHSPAELSSIQEAIQCLGIYDSFNIVSELPANAIIKERAILESYDVGDIEQQLTESLSTGAIEKAGHIIMKYLRRKTGNPNIFTTLGLEHFMNSKGKGYGIRFYALGKKIESWRFNWTSKSAADYHNLSSIDLWTNNRQGPDFHMEFEKPVSLIQILPQFADMLSSGKVNRGSFMTYPDGISLKESAEVMVDLTEAVDPSEAFDGVLNIIASPNFTKNKVWSVWKSLGVKIFTHLEMEFPALIVKAGRGYSWEGSDKDIKALHKEKDRILQQLGAVRSVVSGGSSKETYSYDRKIDELEAQREHIGFQKQLEDLENLIKLTISGASNALFVAGRGGISKTYTVEKVLAQAGLKDGNGYFKNTGTASAAGIYTLLFKYQNQIILFDDSDDALKDMESRNMIKAATDTKSIRKLVWNKMGKNVIDPENYDGTHEEMIDDGKIPRYFNFTGKIIFISNLSMDKLDPDGAIRTRAFIIDINPTDIEVYDYMDTIVDKMQLDGDLHLDISQRKGVVELLRTGASSQTANLRKLSRALNMKAGALKSGVDINGNELSRMIATYA